MLLTKNEKVLRRIERMESNLNIVINILVDEINRLLEIQFEKSNQEPQREEHLKMNDFYDFMFF